jgi:DNA (cytosine-5)-methyltransferase 1
MAKMALDTGTDSRLRVLDLFCGCGGMTTGLTEAGLNVVAGIDVWKCAIDSYTLNHPDHLALCADLQTLNPSDVAEQLAGGGAQGIDILVGGPPCQGFSIAGRRDHLDPRNSLFMEFVKYLDYFAPKAFLMENVIGILSMKNGQGERVIDIILSFLTRNYVCSVSKLYASDYGVPQRRRRVIIIGVRKDLGITPSPPPPVTADAPPNVGNVLEPRSAVPSSYFLSERALEGIRAKRERSQARNAGFGAQFLDVSQPSYTIPARYWKDGYDALVRYSDTEVRRLTVTELKRIQSFPDAYRLTGSKRVQIVQIGNAVACRFAYHLGRHLITMLPSSQQ